LERGGTLRGYFAAVLVRKGPFRILGSPLSGTMSEYLGPIGHGEFPVEGFLEALERFCRDRRIHQLELGSAILPPELMRRHGYEVIEWSTLEVGLRAHGSLWETVSGKARNRIRRAQTSRLVARDTADPEFARNHFVLVEDVFRRQGLRPPFSQGDFEVLCNQLRPRDEVFTVEVRHPDHPLPVASGIFPHDRGTVYSLSAGSSQLGREWCANDLMHWTVMELAASRGLSRYRMGDNYRAPRTGGRFKDKFGGHSEPVFRFVRHYSTLARYARRAFVALRRLRQRAGPFRGG